MCLGDTEGFLQAVENDYCAHLWHFNRRLALRYICTLLESLFHSESNSVIFNRKLLSNQKLLWYN